MFKKAGYALVATTVWSIVFMGSIFATDPVGQVKPGFGTPNPGINPGVPGADATANDDSLITTIQSWINRLLGILGLIALIVLLWGGFQMVTAAGDDGKYKEGFKILKQAGIGLLFIGLAWLFVSLIFFVIDQIA